MSAWPGNPVASMTVSNFGGGTFCYIQHNSNFPNQQTVSDINIDFEIDISFNDHPWFDNGRGYFSARVEKLTTSGWQQIASNSSSLGDDDHDGDWSDQLTISVTMTEVIEEYRILLHCETQDTSLGTSRDSQMTFVAVQGESYIGDFTLDYIPLSIVYCPPGQDMTASLTQSISYGTRFTIGETSGMKAETGVEFKVDFLGLVSEGVGFSESQSFSNTNTSGIQVSHFRNTVVTADNQRAIGRAYWGPLGDLFVILVNPQFAASRRADGTILYSPKDIRQVIVAPAWKLLRPNHDPIVSVMPADVRKRLLELDPFIQNLDQFFPDSGVDISVAANPFADPSSNNRAELIGRWWLDTGTEIVYSEGESHQLFNSITNEVSYESTVTINASVGINYNGLAAALGVTSSNTTFVGLQESKETNSSYSKTAACFLLRNQNDRDLDGIELYYDKIFSTFMFRRVRSRYSQPPIGELSVGVLIGRIIDRDSRAQRGIGVSLVAADGGKQYTSADATGKYAFYNLAPGRYTLSAGDVTKKVIITEEHSFVSPQVADLPKVRRIIDLERSSHWEVSEALRISSSLAQKLAAHLQKAKSKDFYKAAREAGLPAHLVDRAKGFAVFPDLRVPKPSRRDDEGNTNEEDDKDTTSKPSGPKRHRPPGRRK